MTRSDGSREFVSSATLAVKTAMRHRNSPPTSHSPEMYYVGHLFEGLAREPPEGDEERQARGRWRRWWRAGVAARSPGSGEAWDPWTRGSVVRRAAFRDAPSSPDRSPQGRRWLIAGLRRARPVNPRDRSPARTMAVRVSGPQGGPLASRPVEQCSMHRSTV